MKKINWLCIAMLAMACGVSWAAEVNRENLVGEWVFVNWAEAETPEQTHAVNVVMDFRADGQVLTEMRKGAVVESYTIEGDTIVYKGQRGDQKWTLISLIPGESMVVDNTGTIMTFKRK